eukprot:3668049-Amphidinium_carterae.1
MEVRVTTLSARAISLTRLHTLSSHDRRLVFNNIICGGTVGASFAWCSHTTSPAVVRQDVFGAA